MKIGIDIRNIGKKRTGDEVVFFSLTKSLAIIDAENEYKLFTDITDLETLNVIKKDLGIINKNNFEIISLKSRNKFCWNIRVLPGYLRHHPVDAYLTQYITPFFVPKKIKVMTIIHDVSFKVYKQFIKKSDLFFLNLLIPRSLKRADKIIAVSRFTRDEIIKAYKVDPEKVDWIHNAVADDFLNADLSEEKLKNVREKYKLPEKYILYLGTLQPRKNIPALIEAFNKIDKFDIKLVVAGGRGHNFDRKIDETIEKYNLQNKIIFPGFIDEEDKPALMKLAEIFVFPSFYEGFGIPILEAFAVGTPVIASNISPHKEIAEYAALYFNPENFQDLAKIMNSLLSDENLRQNLIQKGSEQAKKFSWEKTAEKMLNIFQGIK